MGTSVANACAQVHAVSICVRIVVPAELVMVYARDTRPLCHNYGMCGAKSMCCVFMEETSYT